MAFEYRLKGGEGASLAVVQGKSVSRKRTASAKDLQEGVSGMFKEQLRGQESVKEED